MNVARAGIMEPFANHTFQPRGLVRRTDLAQAMARLLARVAAQHAAQAKGWESAPHLNWKPTTNGHVGPQTALRSKRTEQAQIGVEL